MPFVSYVFQFGAFYVVGVNRASSFKVHPFFFLHTNSSNKIVNSTGSSKPCAVHLKKNVNNFCYNVFATLKSVIYRYFWTMITPQNRAKDIKLLEL